MQRHVLFSLIIEYRQGTRKESISALKKQSPLFLLEAESPRRSGRPRQPDVEDHPPPSRPCASSVSRSTDAKRLHGGFASAII